MTDNNGELTLNEAASRFLGSLPPEKAGISQQAIYKFVRWFGRERLMNRIVADEVAKYTKKMPSSVAEYKNNLELVKSFLIYARKEGWIKKNLAVYIKIKKEKAWQKENGGRKAISEIPLTRAGYDSMERALSEFKSQKPFVIEEVRRAAEDKDFRENAPLDAAKERLGHLEGKIRELEETLKIATIIDGKTEIAYKVCTGESIILIDLSSGEELKLTIVNPREVNAAEGKVSNASPIGRTVVGQGVGDVVEIEAPAGRLRYRVEKIERR
ncbi:MAG: GreA/GreB family elongation factor [Chloroflexota bacterium]